MRRQAQGMTLIEAGIIVVIMAFLLFLLIFVQIRAREESRKKACQENLRMIGIAVFAYTQSNIEYSLFSWGPADKEPPRRKDGMTSIAELYPLYLNHVNSLRARHFRCPSTKDRAWFRTNAPRPVKDRNGNGQINDDDVLPSEAYVWSNRNHTLMNSSYGYDCRIYPSAVGNHAILGDMDGTQGTILGRSTANHRDGQNVLYLDCSAKWQNTNFCSNDRNDNTFAEDPWHADTDSFISDNTPPGPDDTPGAFNDLSVSYDDYPDLPPRGFANGNWGRKSE